ncbi:hypothetical protein [Chelativorans sp. AA-79]|uniref:hypothetical protein n=1 Tax=Chelativorans sp. AA-79 TaxID=3028735 RepID=UPI0023F83653|nr:hypothetical protein [Chelativorans sp. AA-79]WEX10311.1 hypothetical protein PVE73_04955 [Chelativorans sp. AA-79]
MRFILIMPEHRKAFDCQQPVQIDEAFICKVLRCDMAHAVALGDDVDLWLSSQPKNASFSIDGHPHPYHGRGFICGRSRLDDCKGLPLRYSLEWIVPKLHFPQALAFRKAA